MGEVGMVMVYSDERVEKFGWNLIIHWDGISCREESDTLG